LLCLALHSFMEMENQAGVVTSFHHSVALWRWRILHQQLTSALHVC
jgi:hypothetical protein